jgi:hypothetical protein
MVFATMGRGEVMNKLPRIVKIAAAILAAMLAHHVSLLPILRAL